ncbi:uncharacterized protein JCM6883_000374 [Sporobolomyces salmoneus]|uniref:uncharacterized protein n=1 Tax=Sporobolomyces salmoneus TaxID=183962 RepID=UPI00317D068B
MASSLSSTNNNSSSEADQINVEAGLASLELVNVVAEVNSELEAPEVDDDHDYNFRVEMSKSCEDDLLGRRVAFRRKDNVKRQMEKLRSPEYVQKAKDDFQVFQNQLEVDLEAADAKHDKESRISMKTDYTVLVAPLLVRLSWLPSNTDPELGINDTRVPILRLLQEMGILEAAKSDYVALIVLHADALHSASPTDTTFPRVVNGKVDWNASECSEDHHAAFVRFNNSIESWRLLNTFGETLNSGISKIWQEKFSTGSGVVQVTSPRIFFPHRKYAKRASRDIQTMYLHYSNALISPSPSLEEVRKEIRKHRASFSYYSRFIYDLSKTFHPSSSLPSSTLSRIIALERDFGEIRYLAKTPLDPDNEWILTRSYLARCLHPEVTWTIPDEISWCYRQLEGEVDSRSWSLEEIESKGGEGIRKEVEKFVNVWKESGRTKIGKTVEVNGLLEEAIAGWKVQISTQVSTPAYPAVNTSTNNSVLFAPAATPDGRFVPINPCEMLRNHE